jgi:NADPH2:quinone reductase
MRRLPGFRSWPSPSFVRDNISMRAWLMDSYSGIESLRLGEVPDPTPGPGEALLRIRFAALNPADAFLARGMYPAKPQFPHILGRDGVGDVIAVGEGVATVRPGDTVGILRCNAGVETWGTLAEKTVVPAGSLAPVPAGWPLEEMAAAPLVSLTAWQALTQWEPAPDRGSLLLITGASGGVGVSSVLLGKSLGFTVVGLSRGAEKAGRLKELGADFVFDPNDPNLRSLLPRKADLAVDNIGGPFFNQLVTLMGYRGRISVVGRSAGPVPEFNTGTLFFRRIRIGGVAVGDYTPAAAQAAWKEIVRHYDGIGKRPVIDSVFPFEEVKTAFARLAPGPMGKVLVRVV